jgi:general secretion pathway protein L
MTTLIITLSPPASGAGELAYTVLNNAGQPKRQGNAPPNLLPRVDDVVLLAPAQALSWHKVRMPKLSRSTAQSKIRAILEGMMEDQVLDDTAQMHFAVNPAPLQDQHQWVCACDKIWLQSHLQTLETAGLRVVRIVPEAFPLPDSDARALHIGGQSESATAVYADKGGVIYSLLATAKALHILPALDDQGRTSVSTEPVVAELAENTLQQKVPIIKPAFYAARCLEQATAAGWDLAQFDLALGGRGRWMQKALTALREWASAPRWRAARWGLGALAVAQLLGLNAWAWKEQSSLATKRESVGQLLTQTFPHVKVVVDAPVQMQREVAALRQATGALSGRDLESLLGRFSTTFGAFAQQNGAPTAIDFVAGEVSLKVIGLTAAQVQAANATLSDVQARLEGDLLTIRNTQAGSTR